MRGSRDDNEGLATSSVQTERILFAKAEDVKEDRSFIKTSPAIKCVHESQSLWILFVSHMKTL